MNIAVIFAGGTGQRMNSRTKPKQFLLVHGKPIIIYTLEAFDQHPDIDAIVVVCLKEYIDVLEQLIAKFGVGKIAAIVPGGSSGQESIRNGVDKANRLYPADSVVIVHDGVRPLIDQQTITDCIVSVKKNGSAVTVVPATETIVQSEDGVITNIIDRKQCQLARAPQCFRLGELHDACHKAVEEGGGARLHRLCVPYVVLRPQTVRGGRRQLEHQDHHAIGLLHHARHHGRGGKLPDLRSVTRTRRTTTIMFDLQEEYASLAQHLDIDWDALAGRHVLVTGATGLIGSLCARTLLERNRLTGAGIIVDALVRDPAKAQAMLGQYTADDGLVLHQGSLEDVDSLDLPADYVIHTACPTASSFFMSHPVETFFAIVDGTRSMLELARRRGAASFVYVSSMEIYGMGNKQRGTEHLLDESAVGYIDPCSVRSCYSEGKRAAENLCVSYHSEYQVPVKAVRLAQTFGPGIPRDDVRLFAALARNAVAGKDFVMKTTGESTRMYSYTVDAVSAILTVLVAGENGVSYNVANPSTYSSIREMADMVYREFGTGDARVIIDVDPNAPYPPEHHLPLDVSRLEALGWRPQVGLEDMYRKLIAYMG